MGLVDKVSIFHIQGAKHPHQDVKKWENWVNSGPPSSESSHAKNQECNSARHGSRGTGHALEAPRRTVRPRAPFSTIVPQVQTGFASRQKPTASLWLLWLGVAPRNPRSAPSAFRQSRGILPQWLGTPNPHGSRWVLRPPPHPPLRHQASPSGIRTPGRPVPMTAPALATSNSATVSATATSTASSSPITMAHGACQCARTPRQQNEQEFSCRKGS